MIITIIIFLVMMAFFAETRITSDPFSIKFDTPLKAIGILFLTIGMLCILAHEEGVGYKKGLTENLDNLMKELKQENEKNNLPK